MDIQTLFLVLSETTFALFAMISVLFGMVSVKTALFMLFSVIIVVSLTVDLGCFNKTCHKIELKSALYQSIFWVTISLVFAGVIYHFMGKESSVLFLTAYVTEKMLSVDNLFVLVMILEFFVLSAIYYHRVIFYGIMGAIVFRGIFIGFGALIISQFYWVLYFFGAFLVYSGYMLIVGKKDDDLEKIQRIYAFARRFLPFSEKEHNGQFFVKENGKFMFTSLFLIVFVVEVSDIIFAVDSIPAVFAITQDSFIVFTSNLFAICGMRSLFFLVVGLITKFHHLQKGVAFVLIFIGLKMLGVMFGLHIPSLVSLGIILGIFCVSLITSVCFPKKVE